MPLSWSEIISRALQFTQVRKDEVSEDAEAKSFWDDFFNVFRIRRRRVPSFYSNTIVYNNYAWPENANEKQVQAVEASEQGVLDARAQFPNASLADLYDPNTTPPALVKAHQALDKAVDLCYRPQPFINETMRIEFLFELFKRSMFGEKKKKR